MSKSRLFTCLPRHIREYIRLSRPSELSCFLQIRFAGSDALLSLLEVTDGVLDHIDHECIVLVGVLYLLEEVPVFLNQRITHICHWPQRVEVRLNDTSAEFPCDGQDLVEELILELLGELSVLWLVVAGVRILELVQLPVFELVAV